MLEARRRRKRSGDAASIPKEKGMAVDSFFGMMKFRGRCDQTLEMTANASFA